MLEMQSLFFRPEKAFQSGVSRVLIDDNSENIHEWEEAGGIRILHKNADYTIHALIKYSIKSRSK